MFTIRKVFWFAGVSVLLLSAGVYAQAPSTSLTPEQAHQIRADLEKQATIGDLLRRAATCEAGMWDLATLKARVAQLEALEKAQDPAKKPSQDAPVKP